MQKILGLAVALFTLFSCGSSPSTTARLGSAGGTLSLESGLTLEVPAGALEQEAEVTMREVEVHGERTIELEPHGLELHGGGVLSVSEDVAGEFEGAESVERHEVLEVRHEDRRARVTLTRLEPVTLHRHRSSGSGHDGGEVGDDRGTDADAGDDHGADLDGGDDHGTDLDGGDDHGLDADAGVVSSGGACVSDDSCACGSDCVSGQCVAQTACATDADCGAGSCREGRRHGSACGAMVCRP